MCKWRMALVLPRVKRALDLPGVSLTLPSVVFQSGVGPPVRCRLLLASPKPPLRSKWGLCTDLCGFPSHVPDTPSPSSRWVYSRSQSLLSSRVEGIAGQDAKPRSDCAVAAGRTGDVNRRAGSPDLFKQILNKRWATSWFCLQRSYRQHPPNGLVPSLSPVCSPRAPTLTCPHWEVPAWCQGSSPGGAHPKPQTPTPLFWAVSMAKEQLMQTSLYTAFCTLPGLYSNVWFAVQR